MLAIPPHLSIVTTLYLLCILSIGCYDATQSVKYSVKFEDENRVENQENVLILQDQQEQQLNYVDGVRGRGVLMSSSSLNTNQQQKSLEFKEPNGKFTCFQRLQDCTEGFTESFWLKVNTDGVKVWILSHSDSNNNQQQQQQPNIERTGVHIWHENNFIYTIYRLQNGAQAQLSGPMSYKKWTHIRLQCNQTTCQLTLNGKLISLTQISSPRRFSVNNLSTASTNSLTLWGEINKNSEYLLDEYLFVSSARSSLQPGIQQQTMTSLLKTYNSSSSSQQQQQQQPMNCFSVFAKNCSLATDHGFYASLWLKYTKLRATQKILTAWPLLLNLNKNGDLEVALSKQVNEDLKYLKVKSLRAKQWHHVEFSWTSSSGQWRLFINNLPAIKGQWEILSEKDGINNRPKSLFLAEIGKSRVNEIVIESVEFYSANIEQLKTIEWIKKDNHPIKRRFALFSSSSSSSSSSNEITAKSAYGSVNYISTGLHAGGINFTYPAMANLPTTTTTTSELNCLTNLNQCPFGASLFFHIKFLTNTLNDNQFPIYLVNSSHGFKIQLLSTKLMRVKAQIPWQMNLWKTWQLDLPLDSTLINKNYFIELTFNKLLSTTTAAMDDLQVYINHNLFINNKKPTYEINNLLMNNNKNEPFFTIGDMNVRNNNEQLSFVLSGFDLWDESRQNLLHSGLIYRETPDVTLISFDPLPTTLETFGKAHIIGNIGSQALSLPGDIDASSARLSGILSNPCFTDINECIHGVTVNVFLRADKLKERKEQVFISTKSYRIGLMNGNLFVHLLIQNEQVGLTNYLVNTNYKPILLEWNFVQFSWSKLNGLQVFVNNLLVGSANKGESNNSGNNWSDLPVGSLWFGRDSAANQAEVVGLVDDMEIWTADFNQLQEVGYEMSVSSPTFELRMDHNSLKNVDIRGDYTQVVGVDGYGLKFSRGAQISLPVDRVNISEISEKSFLGFSLRCWLQLNATQTSGFTLWKDDSLLVEITATRQIQVIFTTNNGNYWKVVSNNNNQQIDYNRWHLIEISWHKDQGLTVRVDLRDAVLSGIEPSGSNDAGSRIKTNDGQIIIAERFIGAINQLQIWSSRIDSLYNKQIINREKIQEILNEEINRLPTSQLYRNTIDLLPPIALPSQSLKSSFTNRNNEEHLDRMQSAEAPSKINSLDFDGRNFIEFNFLNKLTAKSEQESLSIDFSVKAGITSGLIWYAESGLEKSYLYLKNSQLHYAYMFEDTGASGGRHTLREDIFVNIQIVPDKLYQVGIKRETDRLIFTVNGNEHSDRKTITGRVPILPPGATVYIGSSVDPSRDTGDLSQSGLQGKISKVIINGDQHSPFDFLDLMNDPNWRSNWSNRGGVQVRREQETSSYREGTFYVSNEPVSITYYKEEALVRFEAWDFIKYKSLEMSFLTNEPRGIMFFTGPASPHTDFVCVELFDGNAFFVVGVNDQYIRVKLNMDGTKANDGSQHTIYFARDASHKFMVRYDGREVVFNQPDGHQQSFSTYTYIGGIDSVSRLPWHVWSRIGFAGCIRYLRINDETYIDPQRTMNQHSSVARGIAYRVCNWPRAPCNVTLCRAGSCFNRFEEVTGNFDCDCSSSARTYPKQWTSAGSNPYIIYGEYPRSEICSDLAPIKDFDGESHLAIEFSPDNRFVTHSDDISLQFKTNELFGTLFETWEPTGKFITVRLENGRVVLETNINDMRNRGTVKRVELQGKNWNDDQWHTLYIKRRASSLEMWVDNRAENIVAEIPLLNVGETFETVIEKIYVGTRYRDITTQGSRFSGLLRNFYWNQYDFFNMDNDKCRVKEIRPQPTLPTWPLLPGYAVTCRSSHKYSEIRRGCQLKPTTDNIFHLQFKTRQNDAVLMQIFSPQLRQSAHITAILFRGKIFILWKFADQEGVVQLQNGGVLNDNEWHRLALIWRPKRGVLFAFVDNFGREIVTQTARIPQTLSDLLHISIGGVPDDVWLSMRPLFNSIAPWINEQPYLEGCLARLFCNTEDGFAIDLFDKYRTDIYTIPAGQLILGVCEDRAVCKRLICLNGGICSVNVDIDQEICTCPPSHIGDQCEMERCPINYCYNGGTCTPTLGGPICQCPSLWGGPRCDLRQCPSGYGGPNCERILCVAGYCYNNGVCRDTNQGAMCECPAGYGGARCERQVCIPNYCYNGGICRDTNQGPKCDCLNNYGGERCDQMLCRAGYCLNGGVCRVIVGGTLMCDCPANYGGSRCELQLCTRDYCSNGGRCRDTPQGPICECSSEYSGSRCETRRCTLQYCLNGGICRDTPQGPICQCNNDYTGERCERERCYDGYCYNQGQCRNRADGSNYCECLPQYDGDRCQVDRCTNYCFNNGRCYMEDRQARCDCRGTNYRGLQCNEPEQCRPQYCLNGGSCSMENGREVCTCPANYEGQRCEVIKCPLNYCSGDRGVCEMTTNGRPACRCSSNYYGSRCEFDRCTTGLCMNNGRCEETLSGPRCVCRPNFSGNRCEIGECPYNYCNGRGTCSLDQDGQPLCRCASDSQFYGTRCEYERCQMGYCLNGGSCRETEQGRTCQCPPQFTGRRCEEDKCLGWCLNNGKCFVNSANALTCDCGNSGFAGPRCENRVECKPGYCQNHGICYISKDKEVCDCSRTGYTGATCSEKSRGFKVGYDKDGYLEYFLNGCTTEDRLTIGFQTFMRDYGTLLTLLTMDKRYLKVIIRNGQLVLFQNNKEIAKLPKTVDDGNYHILSMDRKGKQLSIDLDFDVNNRHQINIDDFVNPSDNCIHYQKAYIGADEQEKSVWRGTLGGFYWNGKYIFEIGGDGAPKQIGDVEVILTPKLPLPPIPPLTCTPNPCDNGGICYLFRNQRYCRCLGLEFGGEICGEQLYGFETGSECNGYVEHNVIPPQPSTSDQIRILLQTYHNHNPIARFLSSNGVQLFEVFMENGELYLSPTENRDRKEALCPKTKFNNGKLHTISLERSGKIFVTGVYSKGKSDPCGQNISLALPSGDLTYHKIILGTDRAQQNFFCGAYGGFLWNKWLMINNFGQTNQNVEIFGGLKIIPLPAKLRFPLIPGKIGGNGQHGGAILLPEAGGIFVGSGHGAGAEVVVGSGPMLLTASWLPGGISWLWGLFILPLLLLLAALLWAIWRCKPGYCPCCVGKGGKGLLATKAALGGAISNGAMISQSQENTNLLAVNGVVDTIDSRFNTQRATSVQSLPYNRQPLLDINRYETSGMSTMRIDQPVFDEFTSTKQNVYFAEDLKVDCSVVSFNSKYVVTGSSTGPPQVWDMMSGDLYKVMDGFEFGCTDLHLACGDAILVGQVHDDVTDGLNAIATDGGTTTTTRKIRKLQLWDFVTGAQIDMPDEVLVTATCVSRDSEFVIAARVLPGGSMNGQCSILVWDILGNQTRMEIFYNPMKAHLKDAVSYLNVSTDDRYVVAGMENPEDHTAHYMVFDLHNTGLQQQPLFVIFQAKVNSTEILNHEEAVTGTEKGELIVWNLGTGRPVRDITNPNKSPAHGGTIHAVVLSYDTQYLVTGGADRLVRVWSMPDEQLIHSLEGHADDVLSVAISMDSEIIVSGSWDGSIRVWRTRDGSQMCWFTSNIEILSVKISNDKRAIVALGERNNHRKLIMLQIVRNRTRRTRQHMPGSPATPNSAPLA